MWSEEEAAILKNSGEMLLQDVSSEIKYQMIEKIKKKVY